MLRAKVWCALCVGAFLLAIFMGAILNYAIDAHGIRDNTNKYFENLNAEFVSLYPARVGENAFFLIGSSRTRYINLPSLSRYVNTNAIRIGMSAQLISESVFLQNQLRAKHSKKPRFLAGFYVKVPKILARNSFSHRILACAIRL